MVCASAVTRKLSRLTSHSKSEAYKYCQSLHLGSGAGDSTLGFGAAQSMRVAQDQIAVSHIRARQVPSLA